MLEDKVPTRHSADSADWVEDEQARGVALDCHGVSQVGRGRRVNQDDYLLAPLDVPCSAAAGPAFLLAVADGIGGGPAGERASAMAVQGLQQFVRKSIAEPDLLRAIDPGDVLRKGVLRCHDEILADIEAHPELFGMGTTITAALVLWPRVWVANAGDSRCYLLRDGRLERLTFDHTLVQKLTDEGILTPETARRSRWRHALLNHLGKSSAPPQPELAAAELRRGDAILLTTDGVTDPLLDAELEGMLRDAGSAKGVSATIVQAAEEKGGRDDKTLVLVRFVPRGNSL
jgi:protein phosphatase